MTNPANPTECGNVFFAATYNYPAGNPADKYVIVLNKVHLPGQPVIMVPTTSKVNAKYVLGCNHRVMNFFLRANQDLFPKDTVIQLYLLNSVQPFTEAEFVTKTTDGSFHFIGRLNSTTVGALRKCAQGIERDIPACLHQYLF